MKRCSAFCEIAPACVSSLFAVCSGSCWLPFSFVRFQLTDFFHHFLLRVPQRLQHFNEGVGIISGDSWLWSWISSHFVNTFCLVRSLLVRHCWPKFCLRGNDAYVSCCPGSWCHLFTRAFIPIYFPTPQQSHQFKFGGPFCNVGLVCLLLY